MPREDSAPSPGSTSQVTSNPAARPTKKKTIVQPQAQETMTKSDETFGSNMAEWCETIKQVMPPIIEKVEEKEMAANLKVGFRKQQQKWLNEVIEVGPSSKKQRMGEKGSSSSHQKFERRIKLCNSLIGVGISQAKFV